MQKEEMTLDDAELPGRKISADEAVTEEHIRRILRAYRHRLKEIGYTGKRTCLFSEKDKKGSSLLYGREGRCFGTDGGDCDETE